MSEASASAVICTRNRCNALGEALASVAKLDISGIRFELVVVDNGSHDDTAGVINRFAATAPFPVRYVHEATPGLSRARNAGFAASSGDYVLATDDDCLVEPDWVKAAVGILSRDRLRLIGGRVELYNPAHLPVTIKTSLEREQLSDPSNILGFVHGANLAFSRQVLDRIGGFDIRLGAGTSFVSAEDMDFVYRAYCAGIPVSYEPGVVVHHNHGRTRESDWFHLMHGYAIGAGATMMKHLLQGRTHLVRSIYWNFVSIFRRHRDARVIATHLRLWFGNITGALRFLFLGSWRPSV